MQEWEYKCLERARGTGWLNVGRWDVDLSELSEALADLGTQGWELVAVVPRSSEIGLGRAGATTEEVWVFKRPKA